MVKVLFIYKNSEGVVNEIVVNIKKRDDSLAIRTFENAFKNVVWREFSYLDYVVPIDFWADSCGVSVDLLFKRRGILELRDYAAVHQYYLREKGFTLYQVGEAWKRDHATISSNTKKIKGLLCTKDKYVTELYSKICAITSSQVTK
jgi:hypothetical protein